MHIGVFLTHLRSTKKDNKYISVSRKYLYKSLDYSSCFLLGSNPNEQYNRLLFCSLGSRLPLYIVTIFPKLACAIRAVESQYFLQLRIENFSQCSNLMHSTSQRLLGTISVKIPVITGEDFSNVKNIKMVDDCFGDIDMNSKQWGTYRYIF